MRLRIKFSKTGSMKFIGHLDTMRFFQKVLRRAEADMCFSEGFSPHILMSFALPLGVGMTSEGEYFDLDVPSCASAKELMQRMNRETGEDFRVLNIVPVSEKKEAKCMTLVKAGDYAVTVKEERGLSALESRKLYDSLPGFLEQKEIRILKKTKRREEETDIRPYIYGISFDPKSSVFSMRLGAGSVGHLKCGAVLKALGEFSGVSLEDKDLQVHRLELLGETKEGFKPLDEIGVSP